MAASAGGARQDFLGPPRILQTFVFILFDDNYRLFIFFLYFLGSGRHGRVQNQRISVFILLLSKSIKSIKKYKKSIKKV